MVSLLATIVGFFSSVVPEFLKLLHDRREKKYALNVLEKQIQLLKLSSKASLEAMKLHQDIVEHLALYSTYRTGITWVDTINGTVRPVLAYCFFFIYSGVKFLQYSSLKDSRNFIDYIDMLWTIDDQAIFAGIVAFYFGQRTFRKVRKNKR